jgi:hypothetical protein
MSGCGRDVTDGRGRERARAKIAVVRVLEKRLGALPVVAGFGRRLRIAEIVDELCPVRPVAWITHGEVIEALVANRLTAPAPMLRGGGLGGGDGGGGGLWHRPGAAQ